MDFVDYRCECPDCKCDVFVEILDDEDSLDELIVCDDCFNGNHKKEASNGSRDIQRDYA